MKGTELFVKALQKEGIDFLFAYPGGYAIDILMNYISRIPFR